MKTQKVVGKYVKRLSIAYSVQKARLYKYLNAGRQQVFLYTDSRGFDITHKNFSADPFTSYPGYFIKRYCVNYFLCPEKHTTLMDFLKAYESAAKEYDFIIAHVGIVDFSPRHQSIAKQVYELKKDMYDKIFGEEEMIRHLNSDLGVAYEGENTINMFSLKMAEEKLIPYLLRMNNLIWIGCNPFVKGWEGNYFRKRPENISFVEEYSRLFCSALPFSVDLSSWADDEVKKYTFDNIHLTKLGEKILINKIQQQMGVIKSAISVASKRQLQGVKK